MQELRGKDAIGKVSAVSPLNFSAQVRAGMVLPAKVKIVDMTLKEGLQMEGMSLSNEECLRVAAKLEELGVATIKIAYRLGRPEDMALMQAMAKLGLKAEIIVQVSNHQHPPLYSLAKKLEAIDRLVDLGYVPFVTIPLSNTLIAGFAEFRGERRGLDDLKTLEIERGLEAIERSRARGGKVVFNLQDQLRCDLDFLERVAKALADAGAYAMIFDDIAMPGTPTVFNYVMRRAKQAAPHGVFGTYVHDDFGFGLGAALACTEAGAEVHFCSINGYGKRGGMVDLGHLAVVLEMMYGIDTGIKLERLSDVCSLFADIYRRPIPDMRPLFGRSAFTNGADWHVQWAAHPDHPPKPEHRWVTQSIAPELIGRKARVTLYSGSGEMGIRVKAAELGIELSVEQAEQVRPLLRDEMVVRKRPLDDDELRKVIRRALPQLAVRRD
ncbi:MAG: hypothetical protein IT531_23540 [Burkholderiales bacterium]|nr:hypothetical protein [Burkholderiales bacterium]